MDSQPSHDLFAYPDGPGSRGVDTSIAAADIIAPKVGRLQSIVLDCIRSAGGYGRTTNEIADQLRIDRGSIQPRTSELKVLGLIADSRQRRANANGKKAIVWISTGGAA